jgi:hypothetical protein
LKIVLKRHRSFFSLLHQLIVQLIRLSGSTNSEISEMSNRCLGEIGPINLNTLILNPAKKLDCRATFVLKFVLKFSSSN